MMISCSSSSSEGSCVAPPRTESRRRCSPIVAAIVEKTVNSEGGTPCADFTYIKNTGSSEVGTRDADFRTVKVGNRGADFCSLRTVFQLLEVGRWIADFRTVEVGNPDADFLFIYAQYC